MEERTDPLPPSICEHLARRWGLFDRTKFSDVLTQLWFYAVAGDASSVATPHLVRAAIHDGRLKRSARPPRTSEQYAQAVEMPTLSAVARSTKASATRRKGAILTAVGIGAFFPSVRTQARDLASWTGDAIVTRCADAILGGDKPNLDADVLRAAVRDLGIQLRKIQSGEGPGASTGSMKHRMFEALRDADAAQEIPTWVSIFSKTTWGRESSLRSLRTTLGRAVSKSGGVLAKWIDPESARTVVGNARHKPGATR